MASTFDAALQNLGIGRTNDGPRVKTRQEADTLTQNDFLKLLTAQLRNQDPTAPVDSTQQLMQLAQFSQVTGITEMNATLKSIADRLGASSPSDALAYVGRSVLLPGDTASVLPDNTVGGAIELAGDASQVRVSIQAANGEIVRTMALGAQKQGTVDWRWDGQTDSGQPAAAGPYRINIAASNDGKSVGTTNLVWAPVTSVSLPPNGTPKLNVAGVGEVTTSSIRRAS
ncbi:flagellar hook assembly protein FlgD [Sphingomonas sp.]|uniref:flagellar hook assembly protein FlgD n=1 Tax=Sphingomonas sp. TaxID=28214 RepID=UPI001E1321B0|nr:flagellar hook assembly protein FlgD [Sphingomonas sp.]MBX9795373.1 flagellar hook assembly protein FlgD [Sphingomonas sp.]